MCCLHFSLGHIIIYHLARSYYTSLRHVTVKNSVLYTLEREPNDVEKFVCWTMAAPRKTNSPSRVAALTVATQSPLMRRSVFLLSVVAIIWLFGEENSILKGDNDKNFHEMMQIRSDNRCLDPGDPPEWNEISIKKDCQCPDPLRPSKRMDSPQWSDHHNVMVDDANYAAVSELVHGHELDVVLLGDSITERWNGTRGMGQDQYPEYRAVFESFFDKTNKSSTAPLQGLALGTGGDISTEMLWHLQNGMLPATLKPKIWFLLIGTNDLGRSGCSKRTGLAGILQVAQYLHTKRPGTPILLHGLLPRNDVYANEAMQTDYTLNRYWRDIMWINRALQKFCSLHADWHYMDAGGLFLQRVNDADHPTGDAQGAVMINKELMPDALHPNVAGYQAWGALIVDKVRTLLPLDY